MERLVVIVTTSDDRQFLEILAHELVKQRVAACAQISGPIHSVYSWQGKVENADEWTLSIKTLASLQFSAIDHVRRRHPYQVPEILVMEPTWVADDYLRWASAQVSATGAVHALHVVPTDEHASEPLQTDKPAQPDTPGQGTGQRWHLFLHGMTHPPMLHAATYGDRHWPTLNVHPHDLREPMSIDFDAFCARLQQTLGAHCEPDGAFGWHPQFGSRQGSDNKVCTSVTGTIHCADQRVLAVEMFAAIRADDWHQFVSQISEAPWLVVQLVEAGVFMSPATMEEMLRFNQSGECPSIRL
ncbi:MAG TPA: divalent-cation tolerance protein CutA [Pirellulaceae bacterium]|nr:divalent-cation tolerance protein CutA [Pirellulaceae bacterium]